jgi:hypothetical protein
MSCEIKNKIKDSGRNEEAIDVWKTSTLPRLINARVNRSQLKTTIVFLIRGVIMT